MLDLFCSESRSVVLQLKAILPSCRCFSNAPVNLCIVFLWTGLFPEVIESSGLFPLRWCSFWMTVSSRPRLLEALKHLLWTDDESRHVETALEDAFKSRASLGENWLINVGGTFSCNALPLFWDPCRTFCARKLHRLPV